MTLEDQVKQLLGEYAFQLCVSKQQIEDQNKRIKELEDDKSNRS